MSCLSPYCEETSGQLQNTPDAHNSTQVVYLFLVWPGAVFEPAVEGETGPVLVGLLL